jgi:hypothetical protein
MSEKAKGWPMVAVWIAAFAPGVAIVCVLLVAGVLKVLGMED